MTLCSFDAPFRICGVARARESRRGGPPWGQLAEAEGLHRADLAARPVGNPSGVSRVWGHRGLGGSPTLAFPQHRQNESHISHVCCL